MWKGFTPMLFFALFWTAIVGLFDVVVGWSLIGGIRSQGFVETDGVVTFSAVTTHAGDRGTNYGVDIRYAYRVNGRPFEGTNYSYAAFSSSDSDWAEEAVNAHPKGTPVRVHYDPADPKAAVLKPGVDSSTLFMLLFLTPFNVVMLGLWQAVGSPLWYRWTGTEPKVVDWYRNGGALYVRLTPMNWIASGFVGAGAAAFVGVFIVAFGSGFHPSMIFIQIMWGLTLSAGVASALYVRQKARAGDYDLIVRDHEVELPVGFDRKRRETFAKTAITGVTIRTIEASKKNTTYEIRLTRRDGADLPLTVWYDEGEAKKLASSLEKEIGIAQRR